MTKRKSEIHPTARPLWDFLEKKKFSRNDVADRLNLKTNNVSNWLKKGIPPARIIDIAEMCGMSTDEYRYQAGLIADPPAAKVPVLDKFEGLPPDLREKMAREEAALEYRIMRLRTNYAAVPQFVRKSLERPANPALAAQWEADIEGVIERVADLKGKRLKDRHATRDRQRVKALRQSAKRRREPATA